MVWSLLFGSLEKDLQFQRKLIPMRFIKYDVHKDEPFRNANGFCEIAAQGTSDYIYLNTTLDK